MGPVILLLLDFLLLLSLLHFLSWLGSLGGLFSGLLLSRCFLRCLLLLGYWFLLSGCFFGWSFGLGLSLLLSCRLGLGLLLRGFLSNLLGRGHTKARFRELFL